MRILKLFYLLVLKTIVQRYIIIVPLDLNPGRYPWNPTSHIYYF